MIELIKEFLEELIKNLKGIPTIFFGEIRKLKCGEILDKILEKKNGVITLWSY